MKLSIVSTVAVSLMGLGFFAFNYSQASEYEGLTMSMLKSVSISWDEAALRQYVTDEHYTQNRSAYSALFLKHKHLGYIKKCKSGLLKSVVVEDSQGHTKFEEDCTFQNGQANVQVAFEKLGNQNKIVGFDIRNPRHNTSTRTNHSSSSLFSTSRKSKSKRKRSRR